MAPVMEIEGLHTQYPRQFHGLGRGPIVAVDGLDLTCNRRDVVAA